MKERELSFQPVETVETRKQKSEVFPKNPEERMAALLASFNIGPKAMTLLLLPENGYISPKDLTRDFRRAVAGTRMEKTSYMTSSGYCRKTLCPIGLVAEEYTLDYWGGEKLVGFGLTEAGKKYGIPAACLALDFELKHQFSLYPVLGPTQSFSPEGKRAPSTRAKILQFLFSQNKPVRDVDLVRVSGPKQDRISFPLEALKRAGVIDYEAVTYQTGRRQVDYILGRLPLERIKPYRDRRKLTLEVARICQDLQVQKEPITQANISKNLSEARKRKCQEKYLRDHIPRSHLIPKILSHLARQEFLNRGRFKGGEIQSFVQITEKGRIIVEEFLRPLSALVNEEEKTKTRLREIAHKVKGNFPQYVQNSTELYYPFSHGFRRKQKELIKGGILELIFRNPGIIMSADLAKLTGLNKATIQTYLLELKKLGKIEAERKKGVNYYYPGVKTDTR